MKYLLLSTLWIFWCFLHSFLVTTRTTKWLKNRLGDKFAFYQIFYNLFSLITVLPMLYWQSTIQGPVVIKLSPYLLFFKYLAMVSGAIPVVGAFFSFDILEFFGIRKITYRSQRIQSQFGHESLRPIITKHGFYGVVRHPMYLGGFIFFVALMTNAPLAQFLGYFILAVYMIIGTVREDRRLTNELGKTYRNYQKEVPMFLPRFISRKKDNK